MTKEESTPDVLTTKIASANSTGGLRLNKSLKTLHEDKNAPAGNALNNSYSAIIKKTVPSKVIEFSEQPLKGIKFGNQTNSTLSRSSSAQQFEREEEAPKISNINGNIIHVTVNNFIAPLNNVNNVI